MVTAPLITKVWDGIFRSISNCGDSLGTMRGVKGTGGLCSDLTLGSVQFRVLCREIYILNEMIKGKNVRDICTVRIQNQAR